MFLNVIEPHVGSFEYLYLLGILGMAASMSIFLARGFAQTSRDLEARLVEVERLSQIALEQERRARREQAERAQSSGEEGSSSMEEKVVNDVFLLVGRFYGVRFL